MPNRGGYDYAGNEQTPLASPRLVKAGVAAGRWQQIVPELMDAAYQTLTPGTPAQGSLLEIRSLPIRSPCQVCAWQGEIQPPVFLCQACGSPAIENHGGLELYLEFLEIKATP